MTRAFDSENYIASTKQARKSEIFNMNLVKDKHFLFAHAQAHTSGFTIALIYACARIVNIFNTF